MSHTRELGRTEAFNMGCDARLRGDGLGTCPFHHENRIDWIAGWRHLNEHYADRAKWQVQRLPPVKGGDE